MDRPKLIPIPLPPFAFAHAFTEMPSKHEKKHTKIPNTKKYRNMFIYIYTYIYIHRCLCIICIYVSNAQLQSSWRISPLTSVQSETFETICWCSQPPRGLRMENVILVYSGHSLRSSGKWRIDVARATQNPPTLVGIHHQGLITTIIRGSGDGKKHHGSPY